MSTNEIHFQLPDEVAKQIIEAVSSLDCDQFSKRLEERKHRLKSLYSSVATVEAQIRLLESVCPHWSDSTREGNVCTACGALIEPFLPTLLNSNSGDGHLRTVPMTFEELCC